MRRQRLIPLSAFLHKPKGRARQELRDFNVSWRRRKHPRPVPSERLRMIERLHCAKLQQKMQRSSSCEAKQWPRKPVKAMQCTGYSRSLHKQGPTVTMHKGKPPQRRQTQQRHSLARVTHSERKLKRSNSQQRAKLRLNLRSSNSPLSRGATLRWSKRLRKQSSKCGTYKLRLKPWSGRLTTTWPAQTLQRQQRGRLDQHQAKTSQLREQLPERHPERPWQWKNEPIDWRLRLARPSRKQNMQPHRQSKGKPELSGLSVLCQSLRMSSQLYVGRLRRTQTYTMNLNGLSEPWLPHRLMPASRKES